MSRNASRKNYREFLSNTKNESQLLKKFTEYLTQEKTHKGLMGRATLNIEKDKVSTSQFFFRNISTIWLVFTNKQWQDCQD